MKRCNHEWIDIKFADGETIRVCKHCAMPKAQYDKFLKIGNLRKQVSN